jgi:hypothetical protein
MEDQGHQNKKQLYYLGLGCGWLVCWAIREADEDRVVACAAVWLNYTRPGAIHVSRNS